MTQNSLQTECPNCHTRFRVTDEQLGVAKGKVRCGHCMEITDYIPNPQNGLRTVNGFATNSALNS